MNRILVFVLGAGLWGQGPPAGPNVAAQKEAMKKLEFLVGRWTGEASVRTPSGEKKLRQTEVVDYRLDGLLILVEGTGRDAATGEVVFHALATITFDDAAKVYRFRAHNGGRYLDTELRVEGKGFEWGYAGGPAKVRNIMKLGEGGEWVEYTEVTMGDRAPVRTVEFTLRRN